MPIPKKPALDTGGASSQYVVPSVAFVFLTPLLWLLRKSLRSPCGSEWRQWATPITIAAGFCMVEGVLLHSAVQQTTGDLPADPDVVNNVGGAWFIVGSATAALTQSILPIARAIKATRNRITASSDSGNIEHS
jgi:hypothetical protein